MQSRNGSQLVLTDKPSHCIFPGGIPEVVIHGDKITITTTATMRRKTDGVNNHHNTHWDDNDERDNLSSDVSS